MPWGDASIVRMDTPQESNDGPILWIRPGEQMLPTAELNANKSPAKRKRAGINELRVITLFNYLRWQARFHIVVYDTEKYYLSFIIWLKNDYCLVDARTCMCNYH